MALTDKVFYDVLKEFPKLKFLFEYGFGYDDKITKMLANKGYQSYSSLGRILENWNQQEWNDLSTVRFDDGDDGNSRRFLIKNNHYQLNKNQWRPIVFSSYGAMENLLLQSKQKSNPYMQYISEDYMVCKIQNRFTSVLKTVSEERYILPERLNQSEKTYILLPNTWTFEKIYADYNYSIPSEIVGNAEGVNKRELEAKFKKERYESFLQMLQFFSEFAPLSTLGYHFLHRLKVPLTNPYVFVRRPYWNDAFEQESIFRCLGAIISGNKIEYKSMEDAEREIYEPIELLYQDNSFEVAQSHLYLKVKGKSETKKEKIQTVTFEVNFYWNQYTEYLRNRRNESIWEDYKIEDDIDCGKIFFTSPYYKHQEWNIDTCVYEVAREDEEAFLMFIYSFGDFALLKNQSEVEEKDWSEVSEKLQEKKGEDGYQYLPLYQGQYVKAKENAYTTMGYDFLDAIEEHSLCNAYNSSYILNKVDRNLPPTKEEVAWLQFILNAYPNFVKLFLNEDEKNMIQNKMKTEYSDLPNLFQNYVYRSRTLDLLGTADKYKKVLNAIKKQYVLQYDLGKMRQRVAIFPYAMEYDVISHRSNLSIPMSIMCYDLKQKRDIIVQIKEIKVDGSLEGNKSVANKKENYEFTILDKIYHLLAYSLRCAWSGQEKLKDIYSHYIDLVFDEPKNKVEEFETGKYERCIRKVVYSKKEGKRRILYPQNYEKKSNMLDANGQIQNRMRGMILNLEELWGWGDSKNDTKEQKEQNQRWRDSIKKFWNDVFQYYYDFKNWENASELELAYYWWLSYFFMQAVLSIFQIKKKKRDFSRVVELDKISNELLWQLINGVNKAETVPNEIVYYDEVLKTEVLKFKLNIKAGELINKIKRKGNKENEQKTYQLGDEADDEVDDDKADKLKNKINETRANVDIVYETFNKYLCKGYLDKEENLCFSIYYEHFNYRDIHMRCMALRNLIDFESIQPQKDKEVLHARLKNIKEGYKE